MAGQPPRERVQHIPEKRQSIRPSRRLWLGLLVLLVTMVVIVVSLWVSTLGDSDCHTGKGGLPAQSRCT